MPDQRKHRGPAPKDEQFFGSTTHATLRAACTDLTWLLTRGYPIDASLALVGNQHALVQRQRVAVRRATCSERERSSRRERELDLGDLLRTSLWIDGYNVLTSIEAALAGGVILACADGTYRDMASMHGSWRRVAETDRAIELLVDAIDELGVSRGQIYLDRPVSNSARLRTMIATAIGSRPVDVVLVADPDAILAQAPRPIATADSGILDRCGAWFSLARYVITRHAITDWIVDLDPFSTGSR
ncbi:MAG: DUF434 domain-containing protein [Planctomycetes bacterium]|nr:DUF434 domain-containing protein [Planctomycetota bacterium]MCB9891242.1 DUF434 domain-containing protein [Planctomycetota bacterium]MCB9919499.1 DUF434 domain-containing protein [Planctomycetota bacterium]